MSDQLTELLARLTNAQDTSLRRQQDVTEAVNTSLAGGLGGLAGLADAMDALRQKPDAYPTVPNEGARQQALASIAQAQLDATHRNAHVANAMNAGVVAGAQGIADVAAGFRQMAQAPASSPEALPPDQLQASRYADRLMAAVQAAKGTSGGDDPITSIGDDPQPAPVAHVCPTCQGSGRVTYH